MLINIQINIDVKKTIYLFSRKFEDVTEIIKTTTAFSLGKFYSFRNCQLLERFVTFMKIYNSQSPFTPLNTTDIKSREEH